MPHYNDGKGETSSDSDTDQNAANSEEHPIKVKEEINDKLLSLAEMATEHANNNARSFKTTDKPSPAIPNEQPSSATDEATHRENRINGNSSNNSQSPSHADAPGAIGFNQQAPAHPSYNTPWPRKSMPFNHPQTNYHEQHGYYGNKLHHTYPPPVNKAAVTPSTAESSVMENAQRSQTAAMATSTPSVTPTMKSATEASSHPPIGGRIGVNQALHHHPFSERYSMWATPPRPHPFGGSHGIPPYYNAFRDRPEHAYSTDSGKPGPQHAEPPKTEMAESLIVTSKGASDGSVRPAPPASPDSVGETSNNSNTIFKRRRESLPLQSNNNFNKSQGLGTPDGTDTEAKISQAPAERSVSLDSSSDHVERRASDLGNASNSVYLRAQDEVLVQQQQQQQQINMKKRRLISPTASLDGHRADDEKAAVEGGIGLHKILPPPTRSFGPGAHLNRGFHTGFPQHAVANGSFPPHHHPPPPHHHHHSHHLPLHHPHHHPRAHHQRPPHLYPPMHRHHPPHHHPNMYSPQQAHMYPHLRSPYPSHPSRPVGFAYKTPPQWGGMPSRQQREPSPRHGESPLSDTIASNNGTKDLSMGRQQQQEAIGAFRSSAAVNGTPASVKSSSKSVSPTGRQHQHGNEWESSSNRCIPLNPPIPSKYWSESDKTKDIILPDFHRLVNYPDNSGKGRMLSVDGSCKSTSASSSNSSNINSNSISSPNAAALSGKKRCVMCGKYRISATYVRAKRERERCGTLGDGEDETDTSHIIPRQNKGVCTACDVTVWVALELDGLEIKWCKGCKNFRPWAAFGSKGTATKCVRCRERQKEKYALQKHASRSLGIDSGTCSGCVGIKDEEKKTDDEEQLHRDDMRCHELTMVAANGLRTLMNART